MVNSPKKAGLPGYTSVASTDALESGRIAHGTSKEAFIDRSEEADDDAGDGETLLARADSNSSSSSPIANYNYPPSSKNTCRCYRASRLVGRINIMKEVPIPEGQEHPKYPGLRTRIVWVIPSGWQMLWVTFGAIIVFPIVVFSTMHAIPAVQYGMPFNILTMIVAAVSLGRTTFKDPGIFPRYMSPQGPDWALCQKTNSYRPPGVVYDHESETLIDKIDHFCPWTGTTIAGNNYREFQIFVVTVFVHLGVLGIVAMLGILFKVADAVAGFNATTISPTV